MEFRNRTGNSGCCGNPAKCAFTTASGRCMAREEHEATIEPENRPAPNFILVSGFEHINQQQQVPQREQSDSEKLREFKRKQARKARQRREKQARERHKGRGRERRFGL